MTEREHEEIDLMSIDDLEVMIRDGDICATENCYNVPQSGVIYCVKCLEGPPERADEKLIYAKKQLRRLRRHEEYRRAK